MSGEAPSGELKPGTLPHRTLLAVVVVVGHAIKHVFNSGMRALIMPEIKIGLGLSGSQFGSLAKSHLGGRLLAQDILETDSAINQP